MITELEAEGWVYKDLPKMTQEYFDMYIDIIGADNIKWITMASYEGWGEKGETLVRGQHMISPAGIQRGIDYANRNRDEDKS